MRAFGKTVVYNYKIPTWRESWYAKNNIHTAAKIEDIFTEERRVTHIYTSHTHTFTGINTHTVWTRDRKITRLVVSCFSH